MRCPSKDGHGWVTDGTQFLGEFPCFPRGSFMFLPKAAEAATPAFRPPVLPEPKNRSSFVVVTPTSPPVQGCRSKRDHSARAQRTSDAQPAAKAAATFCFCGGGRDPTQQGWVTDSPLLDLKSTAVNSLTFPQPDPRARFAGGRSGCRARRRRW